MPVTAELVGRLPSADRALDALTDLRMAQPPDAQPPICRRDPDGALWIVAEISPEAGAGILWTEGGDVFVTRKKVVLPHVRPGSPVPRRPAPTMAELSAWPQVTMLELLARTTARTEVTSMSGLIGVLTSARLAHHILRTCLAAGAEVSHLPVERRALFPPGPPESAVLLDVEAARAVPVTVLRELAALPFTTVGRYADQASTLLVDASVRLPADITELTRTLAADQLTVIGRADADAWLVRPVIAGMRPTAATRTFTMSARPSPSTEPAAGASPARPSIARAQPIADAAPPAPVTLVPSLAIRRHGRRGAGAR